MVPPPKPPYPPKRGQKPPFPPPGHRPGVPPPPGFRPKPGMPPPPGQRPGPGMPPPHGRKPGMPPHPGYKPGPMPGKPMYGKPGPMPPRTGGPPRGPPGKPGLLPPPPPGMKAPPPPKPKAIAKPKKAKKKRKFFDSIKKKVAVIIVVIGLVIGALGFFYPPFYWKSRNSHSGADLDKDQTGTAPLILYGSWDAGAEVNVHSTVVSIKPMIGSAYIEGVTYLQKIDLSNNVRDIGDTFLVEIENNQYFLVPGVKEPPISEGETITFMGQVKMILGKDSGGNDVRREIFFVNSVDIEKNNMDQVFFSVAIFGIVLLLAGFCIWMFFVFAPTDKEPAYVNVHEQRKKDFIEQVATPKTGKDYPCPICGLNMSYKAEFSKWYCEICNKMM